MAEWMECFRGVVYPWDCDHLGHMNVKGYTGMFDQAAFHLQHRLGLGPKDLVEAGETAVDAQHTVRFLNEQLAGSLIVVDGALTKLGTKSFTCTYRMHNVESDEVAATTEIVSVYFSTATRSSMEIPAALRARLVGSLVTDP
ncbi:MAG: thioesterase [Acidimicrobiia bacterium]|nr:thioesterase [Acidimicrobiia bacterium]